MLIQWSIFMRNTILTLSKSELSFSWKRFRLRCLMLWTRYRIMKDVGVYLSCQECKFITFSKSQYLSHIGYDHGKFVEISTSLTSSIKGKSRFKIWISDWAFKCDIYLPKSLDDLSFNSSLVEGDHHLFWSLMRKSWTQYSTGQIKVTKIKYSSDYSLKILSEIISDFRCPFSVRNLLKLSEFVFKN